MEKVYNVRLPIDLIQGAKLAALQDGTTMRQVVIEAIRKYLTERVKS